MPIVGFRFTSMEGKRLDTEKGPSTAEIKVNSTPRIISIKEVDVATFKEKALSIVFEFETNYDPKLAEIKITGDILYIAKDNANVMSEWKKDKKLPDEVNIEILNNLFRRCLVKISTIADDLQLPPPLQLPRVMPKGAKGEEAGYVG
jgi:hypothetical protein